jgi:putative FmdB family regulatory protein
MPIYEYRCAKCGGLFEVLQRFSDAPVATHEGCGGAVERLISASAFQFKGSGFYLTDYAKGSQAGPKPEGKSDGKSEGTSSEKPDSKSDSKSESKSDSKAESKSDSAPASESKSTDSKPTVSTKTE